jgi:glycosyltransferase involved in cell wall biosynthesis
MHGAGQTFLKQSFEILIGQTYKDFDIVISDHSQDQGIENLCRQYSGILDIHYYKNTEKRGSSSANINNAILHAEGKLIKILFQDDFLYHAGALAEIVKNFDMQNNHWLVTACIHTKNGIDFFKPYYPRYNKHVKNTISSPSVLTIKNDHPLLFNESLLWFMDWEYYRRCFDAFGEPKIITGINVVNRISPYQVSQTSATFTLQLHEYIQMLQKYESGLSFWYYRSVGYIKYYLKTLINYKP